MCVIFVNWSCFHFSLAQDGELAHEFRPRARALGAEICAIGWLHLRRMRVDAKCMTGLGCWCHSLAPERAEQKRVFVHGRLHDASESVRSLCQGINSSFGARAAPNSSKAICPNRAPWASSCSTRIAFASQRVAQLWPCSSKFCHVLCLACRMGLIPKKPDWRRTSNLDTSE